MTLKKVNKTYHVCFKSENGTPMEVDTGCENYEEAKLIAGKSKADELEQVAKVMKLTSDIVTRIVSGEEITMEIAHSRYKVWANKNLSSRTADSHVSYSNKWLRDSNLLKVSPATVDEGHVSDWINPEDDPIKASTRRVRKSSLKSFLGFCNNKGWMLGKPADLSRVRMGDMTHEQKETQHRKSMNEEDIKAIIKVADPFWKMATFLAAETGLRLGDICSLEWACFDGNYITVWTDKRDKRVRIMVPSKVVNSLCGLPVSDPTYVFPDRREVYRDSNRRAGLSVQFKRLCVKAADESGRSSLKNKSFHGLRSYYAKANKNKGKSVEVIAKELGHSSTKTTDIYIKA